MNILTLKDNTISYCFHPLDSATVRTSNSVVATLFSSWNSLIIHCYYLLDIANIKILTLIFTISTKCPFKDLD